MHFNTPKELQWILFPPFPLQSIEWDGILPKASALHGYGSWNLSIFVI